MLGTSRHRQSLRLAVSVYAYQRTLLKNNLESEANVRKRTTISEKPQQRHQQQCRKPNIGPNLYPESLATPVTCLFSIDQGGSSVGRARDSW